MELLHSVPCLKQRWLGFVCIYSAARERSPLELRRKSFATLSYNEIFLSLLSCLRRNEGGLSEKLTNHLADRSMLEKLISLNILRVILFLGGHRRGMSCTHATAVSSDRLTPKFFLVLCCSDFFIPFVWCYVVTLLVFSYPIEFQFAHWQIETVIQSSQFSLFRSFIVRQVH